MPFNRMEARSGRRKTETEQVFAEVPAIIEPLVFEQVQRLLKARNPRVTAPRIVTGPCCSPAWPSVLPAMAG
jgi:site-specific DNA recombinase